MLQRQIDDLEMAIQSARYEQDGGRYTVKQIEKTRKTLQTRLEKLNQKEKKDQVVTFEELGVDHLYVDEAHGYKNAFLYDEYATLNFFRFICKNIGNLGNGEIEKMVTCLKHIDQKAVENHVNGAVWAFDYDKMFCVLMENEICRKVCEKNKYNSWTKLIGQYCVSMA